MASKNPHRWGRRRFVEYSGMSALALALGPLPTRSAEASTEATMKAYPFTLGIASGDPLPDAVILWTRLAPEPLESQGGMGGYAFPVLWQVARDESFRRIVRQGIATARPEFVHSVHVDVRGLQPGTEYFYRFRAGTHLSETGRTKTAPAPHTMPTDFKFAVVSCQAWFDGYYSAYQHLAQEDLDLVVHLGDYLYEYGVGTNGGRPDVTLPDKYLTKVVWLNDYRDRYALYKMDTNLQAAHAKAPWVLTWDDHEVIDNYASLHHPSIPDSDFPVRRANAYRAYWEHMPLRPPGPVGPDLPLYRRFTFGDLVEFNVLDSRQYRDRQACNDGLRTNCAERLIPTRTMLGQQQEQWLYDGFAASTARWNMLGQQLVMAQIDFNSQPGQAFSMDMWDGYKPARDRLLASLTGNQVQNPVVLSGDFHRAMAMDIKQDFDNPDSPTVASEFLGSSISSSMDGSDMDDTGLEILKNNPHVKFYHGQRGYLRCKATPDSLQADYRAVPYVKQPGAPVYTRASFVVENGVPGAKLIDEAAPRGRSFSTSTNVELPEPLLHLDEDPGTR